MVIAAVAALFLFIAVWKVIKTVVVAAIVAVLAAGALYYLMPRLEDQAGIAGDAARKTQKLIKKVKDENKELSDQVKATADEAKKIIDTAKKKAKGINQ